MTLEKTQPMPKITKKNKKVNKKRFILKRLTIWLIFSLLLQTGVLVYLNYWLTGTGNAKETIISSPKQQKIKDKESYKFTSTGQISSYSVSYDAKYFSFVDDEGLKIYDAKAKKVIYNMVNDKENAHEARTNDEIVYPKGTIFKVSNLKWLPDRNKLIYAFQWETYAGGPVNIDIYISNFDGSNKVRMAHFKGQAKGTIVKNIALSTMTNLINIQLETPYKTTQLYQVGIMSSMKQIAGSGKEIGNIAVAPKDGSLYAEIHQYKNSPPKISLIKDWSILDVFQGGSNFRLLGIDNDGKLYLGEQTVTGVNAIYTATIKKETRSYTKLEENPAMETKKLKTYSYIEIKASEINKLFDLTTPVDAGKIYVHNDGDVIIDNSPENDYITVYHDGIEHNRIAVVTGNKEVLLYNKYIAVLKKTGVADKNEIVIYNLEATK